MANTRIAWSKDDDLRLVESVLNALRHGNSALSGIRAFAEANGNRSFEASKFRWFTVLKVNYEQAIELAKATAQPAKTVTTQPKATSTAVEKALVQLQKAIDKENSQWNEWKAKYEALQLEYEMLADEYVKLKNAVKVIQDAQTHAWKIDKNGVVISSTNH